MTHDHPDHDGYDGPATVASDEAVLDVDITLRGGFQPIDGRYHWYGRIAKDDRLDDLGRSGATVVLTTPDGRAEGRLSDMDPWGRYRIAGMGRPPFPVNAPG